ncbi:MAG: D-alanine--D-alanine ligase, partial [Bacilli bacterium]
MKLKIGVIFGGSSVEHEISIISASQVIKALDPNKYTIIPLYINKEGDFYYGEALSDISNFKDIPKLINSCNKVNLVKEGNEVQIHKAKTRLFEKPFITNIDVFFPVVHGTYGEDGRLQGLLEMLKATFVGCETKGAVNGQDKVFMKNILRDNNIPVVDFTWFYANEYHEDNEAIINKVMDSIKSPWIVKPASLGSSVGISKASNQQELAQAIEEALKYDYKIIVEQAIEKLCEVNCAVLGDYSFQRTSIIEEVVQTQEILSYSDKYQSNGKTQGMASAKRYIPAQIDSDLEEQVHQISKEAFRILNLAGNT